MQLMANSKMRAAAASAFPLMQLLLVATYILYIY